MNRMAVAGVALALIGVFAALAVSVVNARRPLDREVSKSFDAVVSKLAGRGATVQPHGCSKTMVDLYRCSADLLSPRGISRSESWRLLLHEDGCWVTYSRSPTILPRDPRTRLGYPRGCTGS